MEHTDLPVESRFGKIADSTRSLVKDCPLPPIYLQYFAQADALLSDTLAIQRARRKGLGKKGRVGIFRDGKHACSSMTPRC